MKKLYVCLVLSLLSMNSFAEELRDVLDKHSEERHHARKEWDVMNNECKSVYPKWYDSSHADYDKNFECQKKVKQLSHALEDKHRAELCEKFRVCKK